MKRVLLSVVIALALPGCYTAGTEEQRELARRARGKNIAKIERGVWRVIANVITGTLTELAKKGVR